MADSGTAGGAVSESYVEYGGRGFWEEDGALRDLLALLADALEGRGLRRKQLDLYEHWTLQAYVFFPGAHDAGLDLYAADAATRALILELLAEVAARTGRPERPRPKGFDQAERELFEDEERFIDTDRVRPLALHVARLLRGEAGAPSPDAPGARAWRPGAG
jgi:hypothetical protein